MKNAQKEHFDFSENTNCMYAYNDFVAILAIFSVADLKKKSL